MRPRSCRSLPAGRDDGVHVRAAREPCERGGPLVLCRLVVRRGLVADRGLRGVQLDLELLADLRVRGIVVDVAQFVRIGVEVEELPLGRVLEDAAARKSVAGVVVVDQLVAGIAVAVVRRRLVEPVVVLPVP